MKVAILLSTYNGAKYLKQQLESLSNQTYAHIEVIARDDGSQDNSLEILKEHKIQIIDSVSNIGAKASFSSLLEYAVQKSDAQYFMFCDQDDIWENDKVEKTLVKMRDKEEIDKELPILIHTDLKVVNESMEMIDKSMWQYEQIDPSRNSLNYLLIHNTITGCTVMINKKLALKSLPIPVDSIMHDWWLGLVASAFGKIYYLEDSTIKYRQHTYNDIGTNKYGLKYIIIKVKNFSQINLHKNIIQAKAFFDQYKQELDQNTKTMLQDFVTIESKSFFERKKTIIKHKLLKNGVIRNIGLFLKI